MSYWTGELSRRRQVIINGHFDTEKFAEERVDNSFMVTQVLMSIRYVPRLVPTGQNSLVGSVPWADYIRQIAQTLDWPGFENNVCRRVALKRFF